MKKSIFLIIILVLLFSQQAYSSQACPDNEKDHKDHRHQAFLSFLAESNLFDARFILEVKDRINLSRQQEEKIENLMLEHETSVIRNGAEIKIKELQFVSYLKSGEMKRKQVEAYIRDVSERKTDMIVHYINHLLDIRAILTAPQIQKLGEIRKKMYPAPSRPKKDPPEIQ